MGDVVKELSVCLKKYMQDFLTKGHEDSEYREDMFQKIDRYVPSRPDETITNSNKYLMATTQGYALLIGELKKTSDPQAIFHILIDRPYFKIYFILHYLETQTEDAATGSSKKTWDYIYDLVIIRNGLSHNNYDYDDAYHLTSIAYNIGSVFNSESILKLYNDLSKIIEDERPNYQSRLAESNNNEREGDEKEVSKTKKQEPSISREQITVALADSNRPSILSSDLFRYEIDVDSYLKIEKLSMPELAERSETDSLASAYMAYCYYSGIRVHKDIEVAKILAEKTINNIKDFKGRHFGYYVLAHLYKDKGDLEKYSQYLNYSIDWNGVDAKYDLALEYLKGSKTFPKSIEKATELLDYRTRSLLPKASTLLALIKLRVFSKPWELDLSNLLSDAQFDNEVFNNPAFNEAYELLKSSSERGDKLGKLVRIQLLIPYKGFINADDDDIKFIISQCEANDSIALYGLAVGVENGVFDEEPHNPSRTFEEIVNGKFSPNINFKLYYKAINAGSEDAILRLYRGTLYELHQAKDGSTLIELEMKSVFSVYDYVKTVEKISKSEQSLTILANAYHDFPMIRDIQQSYRFANELMMKLRNEDNNIIPSTVYCILLEECQEIIHNDKSAPSIERCISKLRSIINLCFDPDPRIGEFEVSQGRVDKLQCEVLSELIELISLDSSHPVVSNRCINELEDIVFQTININVCEHIEKIRFKKHGTTSALLSVGEFFGNLEAIIDRLKNEYEQQSQEQNDLPDPIGLDDLKEKIDILSNMKENGIQCAEEYILDALSDICPDKKIYYMSDKTGRPHFFTGFPEITRLYFSPEYESEHEYASWSDFGYEWVSARISPYYLLELMCSNSEMDIFVDWKISYYYRLLSTDLAKYYLTLANTTKNKEWNHKAVLLLTYACLPQKREKRLHQFSPSEALMLLSECYASGVGVSVDTKRSQQYLEEFKEHQDPTDEEIDWAYDWGLFGE